MRAQYVFVCLFIVYTYHLHGPLFCTNVTLVIRVLIESFVVEYVVTDWPVGLVLMNKT